MVDKLGGDVVWYKVGLQLYLAAGQSVLDSLRERGKRIFLDLKLHDIPNTVAGAVSALRNSGAELLTVHAGGGPAMLAAAVAARAVHPISSKLLAVTVLTSMDESELHSTGIAGPASEQVERLASAAVKAGVSGLVCSTQEIAMLRRRFGRDLLLVVPGIRASNAPADDQRRVATATQAMRLGASMLVVGRPITEALDVRVAARSILREIDSGLDTTLTETKRPG